MSMLNLFSCCKVTRVSNAEAAAATDITTTALDMTGFNAVAWLVPFGAITTNAVTGLRAQQGAAANMSDAADIVGTAVTVADDQDNKVFGLVIYRPQERYVRLIVDRGTQNAVVDAVIAFQYNARDLPVTHDSTTVGTIEYHAEPIEGTA